MKINETNKINQFLVTHSDTIASFSQKTVIALSLVAISIFAAHALAVASLPIIAYVVINASLAAGMTVIPLSRYLIDNQKKESCKEPQKTLKINCQDPRIEFVDFSKIESNLVSEVDVQNQTPLTPEEQACNKIAENIVEYLYKNAFSLNYNDFLTQVDQIFLDLVKEDSKLQNESTRSLKNAAEKEINSKKQPQSSYIAHFVVTGVLGTFCQHSDYLGAFCIKKGVTSEQIRQGISTILLKCLNEIKKEMIAQQRQVISN